ncbi:MAG: M4 family metallopeptidase [Acidovorax sp.]|nr:M4 family metallopeptidase [Acidovorax sp.]
MYHCTCGIVPRDVLERLSEDKRFGAELRKAAADSARVSDILRRMRHESRALLMHDAGMDIRPKPRISAPKVQVYNCRNTTALPGRLVVSPSRSADTTVQRVFKDTTSVATFYREVFSRNSLDNAGISLISSVHYGVKYNNAMWNGSQMVYGDGDGNLFLDFTLGNDVIGHELAHGVTQYTLDLAYSGDAGGLNESLSDCFGTMFRQWQAGQTVDQADWLIGADILGPAARERGYTCLRSMANPADKTALAPQPTRYADLTPDMDPHYSSGPPNLAFCTACVVLGGKSWESIGQVWYRVMTTLGARPSLSMPDFAEKTRQAAEQMYPSQPAVLTAVDKGWKAVGL